MLSFHVGQWISHRVFPLFSRSVQLRFWHNATNLGGPGGQAPQTINRLLRAFDSGSVHPQILAKTQTSKMEAGVIMTQRAARRARVPPLPTSSR